jgi:hypothetical protein
MPKAMHDALKKQAKKLFGSTKSKRASRYIYGTLAKFKSKGKLNG